MKKTRIIAAVVLAAMMVFALSFTAFAKEDVQILSTSAPDTAEPAVGVEAPVAAEAAPADGANAVDSASVGTPAIGGGDSKDAATDTSAETQTQPQAQPWWKSLLSLGIPILILVAFFYFGMYKPQKKQEKEKKEMMDNLKVGAEVMTIGGIIGRVVTVRDESVVIESGSDKNKLEISKQAISSAK